MDGTTAAPGGLDLDYRLPDNLTRASGRIFVTGPQALVRMMITQRRLDRQQGLNTAGFATGYRGSPLAGVDLAMWRAADELQAHEIAFMPAINEDMAATVLMGTQQAGLDPDRTVDGVFGLWYGKGPGLDRAGDALHHGHAAGASRHGGVLLVVGDDHTAASSSIPHASEASLAALRIPVLYPASVEEYEAFGLYGWALSRYSGAWVAMKAVSETVESGRSYDVSPPASYGMPEDASLPRAALEYGAREFLTPAIEMRVTMRLRAVAAFSARHSLDRLVSAAPHARAGIVATGKACLDAIEALTQLGIRIDAQDCPVRLYKPGLVWPLDARRLADFARGLDCILVIEEKGCIVETQIKDMLYNARVRPIVEGKLDASGATLIPGEGQLRPSLLAGPLAGWLARAADMSLDASKVLPRPEPLSNEADAMRRLPYFCPGCPHSTSTRVPQGSKALAGVGCHYMAAWMDRDTGGLTQMGGEGADWIGLARYTRRPHVFQNMGEGTYYHSGHLAIRQAVAAGANITYKILFNDAVAMTGGQPVDGPLSVPGIARQMLAEGVRRVVITSDDAPKYRNVQLPPGVQVHDRHDLDRIQRELREVPGVTVLIHDQACAAEKRRRRRKNAYPDPPRRLFINTEVCEGCGDCGLQSNCLALVPVETADGRKRAIDQSTCNKDYSCVDGFCPSFVSVLGGRLRRQAADHAPDAGRWQQQAADLPEPDTTPPGPTHNVLVAGMGGTGVVTIGAVLAMAAHLEGRAVSLLDMTGMAQKGGSVLSHLRIAARGGPAPAAVRIDWQQADTLMVCDPVAGVGADALGAIRPGHTRVVVNSHVAPLSEFTRHPDVALRPEALLAKLRHACGGALLSVDAHQAAQSLFGDGMLANMFLLGLAWQQGAIPVSRPALEQAIRLNGVAVQANLAAFACGRVAGDDARMREAAARPPAQIIQFQRPPSLEHLLARGVAKLTAYQDADYARSYADFVAAVSRRERQAAGQAPLQLARQVAVQLLRLMAYKDEYEVARLYTDGSFARQLAAQFEGDYTLRLHMAPPLLARKDPRTGAPRKMSFGPGVLKVLRVLAHGRRLRGTWLDPFGHMPERRMERALIAQYRQAVEAMLPHLHAGNLAEAAEIAALVGQVRGFGHVKARAVQAYRARLAERLAAFCAAGRAPAPEPGRRRA